MRGIPRLPNQRLIDEVFRNQDLYSEIILFISLLKSVFSSKLMHLTRNRMDFIFLKFDTKAFLFLTLSLVTELKPKPNFIIKINYLFVTIYSLLLSYFGKEVKDLQNAKSI